jgi:hypothetical protein
MATLPCENGGGSLNNPNNPPTVPGLNPYTPFKPCVGEWQISSLTPDDCALNDQKRQESYVAEVLNISGAPVNIFKLLGVHEQGNGSLLATGKIMGSVSYPGYPITGVNGGGTPWRTIQAGPSIISAQAYIGIDFGIKRLPSGTTEYEPHKTKWTKVAAIAITQANTPNEWAKQVKVEIADGQCEYAAPIFSGVGDGAMVINGLGSDITQGTITAVAITSTTFNIYATLPDNSVIGLNSATVGVPFFSTYANFTINYGVTAFVGGDMFTIPINYVWKRAGIFNLIQSPLPQTLNLQTGINVRAIRVTPTMFTGSGSWEVSAFDPLDSAPTDINNIQDLFFNENRDRDYSVEPILLKVQYSPADSISDLSRFGLSILDQYSFTISFVSMINALGRPIVTGDILEVTPELQYDQNLKPIRKFVEVTDTGWAAEGFSTSWRPTVYRFSAQQAVSSQETRDIFGTMDTQKYLIADSMLTNGIGEQIDFTPLTITEEIAKEAANKVPEIGSDDQRHIIGQPLPPILAPVNLKGQPTSNAHKGKQNIYIEDGLPPNDEPYGEGFKLPDPSTVSDGDYFRLSYPPEVNIPPRLFRFSTVKNRWLFLESDRRGINSSHKPSVRSILESSTKQGLAKKTT